MEEKVLADGSNSEAPQRNLFIKSFSVNIYNSKRRQSRKVTMEIDTQKYPPARYAHNNIYYALEVEGNQFFCTRNEWYETSNKDKKNDATKKRILASIVALLTGALVVYVCYVDFVLPAQRAEQERQAQESEIHVLKRQPFPEHGTTSFTYEGEEVGTFEINLSQGEKQKYYYIKLVDAETREIVQDVFMHPATTCRINVPYGEFYLMYASGYTWYGYTDLFGPNGEYNRCDSSLLDSFLFNMFSPSYTVTLEKVEYGNISTVHTPYENF